MINFNTSDEVIPCGCGFDDVSFPHSCNPKVNYWADVIAEDVNGYPSYWPVIYANGDILYKCDVGFPCESHANLAANFYITGFKHARGES